jgi:hypothetical protein
MSKEHQFIENVAGAPEDTRGNKEGHQKDRRRRDTTRTGGQRGIGRDTKRTGGNNGGIGAGRKATGTQHSPASIAVPVLAAPCGPCV